MNCKIKNIGNILCILTLSIFTLVGCGQSIKSNTTLENEVLGGGTLCLKVNPEIEIHYDKKGFVTNIEASNTAAIEILENYTNFVGKDAKIVVNDLVTIIGKTGYFIEDSENKYKHITIEIKTGSYMPSNTFLRTLVNDIRKNISNHNWEAPVLIELESLSTITDYQEASHKSHD